MTVSLNGSWKLYYHADGRELPEYPAWPCIEAQVPGNVELDLWRAGVEKDPFFGENIYDYRKYEFYRWVFEKTFELPEKTDDRLNLVFEGLNTFADVYVNDVFAGHCENMFIAHAMDVTEAVHAGKNVVRVMIASAANTVKDMDFPVYIRAGENGDEFSRERKPPHSFGWDIMPRFPSAGMWRGVRLESVKANRITQTYFATRSIDLDEAEIACSWRFTVDDFVPEGYSVRITVGDAVMEKPALFCSGSGSLRLKHPRLWWPRGYGEANLYTAKTELLHNGIVLDAVEETIGVRLLKVEHVMKPGDEGEFKIICNGCPILAKGSNWVPLDAMHSRDAERYEKALALFDEANCNIVRCWGGNVYEDHAFFDLCDRYGIMVWQDFAMACATYSHDEAFLKSIEEEASAVVRKLRNHASILLWAGDNECDEGLDGRGYHIGNRYNPITREVLPRAVRMNDPYRMFLPSSPYIDFGIARYQVPEQHNWGARAYFKDDFYKQTSAHFISECGYHGCPAPETLAKFLPADKLWPMTNSAWKTHNTDYLLGEQRGYDRNQLMEDQVRIFFGEVPDTLEAFSKLSQVVQAEAKKFFVERTRIKKWRRTGIIWWNMLDGWPQISDAIVDYYFTKKRAFQYIKRIQQKTCLMMDELSDWSHDVVLGNDSWENFRVQWQVTDGDSGEVVLQGETMSPANENVKLGSVRIMPGQQRLFLLTWEADGKRYGNHYITGFPCYDANTVLGWLEKIDKLPCGEA
ncbi:MAG: glycoside hydrolase family 2 TIM barrel-domain containing protein [Eubacteriales bacterium]|nr:glycoside hydrolase family 2 TIM barrel-domain containing protein [Eubacteriales bacterium]